MDRYITQGTPVTKNGSGVRGKLGWRLVDMTSLRRSFPKFSTELWYCFIKASALSLILDKTSRMTWQP